MRACFLSTFVLFPLLAASPRDPFSEIFFEQNLGQAGARVEFVARSQGVNIAFTHAGLEFQLSGSEGPSAQLRFPGLDPKVEWQPLDSMPSTSAYYLGADPSKWIREVRHYKRLKLRGLYPGIDAIFYGNEGRLEYDFVVSPGADPSIIHMAFDAPPSLTKDGNLVIKRGRNSFEMLRPLVYQETKQGERRPIKAEYKLRGRAEIVFELGAYDKSKPLVVDPVLKFSTRYGGEKDDSVVALSALGDMVGVTSSLSFGDGLQRRGKDIFALVVTQHDLGALPVTSQAGSQFVFLGGWWLRRY